MLSIKVRNVSEALATALVLLEQVGETRESRNGKVLAFKEPFTTTYMKPRERVLCSPMRRANPVFHLLESFWMLAGRRDVKFPATVVKRMNEYSDDKDTFWGAYGYRWREFFGWDQIGHAIRELRDNPTSRRVVIAMWNAMRVPGEHGLDRTPCDFMVGALGGKDVPCNTHIYLDLRDGNLNMTVCCRSNDILWGCYGANAVHMSMLQEYIASALGVEMGWYSQMSNDLHLYEVTAPIEGNMELSKDVAINDIYRRWGVTPITLLQEGEKIEYLDDDIYLLFDTFDRDDLEGVLNTSFMTDYFNFTVRPMVGAWLRRKEPDVATRYAEMVRAPDWAWAMREWLAGVKA